MVRASAGAWVSSGPSRSRSSRPVSTAMAGVAGRPARSPAHAGPDPGRAVLLVAGRARADQDHVGERPEQAEDGPVRGPGQAAGQAVHRGGAVSAGDHVGPHPGAARRPGVARVGVQRGQVGWAVAGGWRVELAQGRHRARPAGPAIRRSTIIDRAASSIVAPAGRSPSATPAVSSTTSQRRPNSGPGRVNQAALAVRAEQQQEGVVPDRLAAGAGLGDGIPVEEDAQRLGVPGLPVAVHHLPAGRGEPGDVAGTVLAAVRPAEEPAAAEHRVVPAQPGHRAGEVSEVRLLVAGRTSPPRTSRCPGSRRCCCRAGSGRSRRRPAASGRPGTAAGWPGSSAAAGPAAR